MIVFYCPCHVTEIPNTKHYLFKLQKYRPKFGNYRIPPYRTTPRICNVFVYIFVKKFTFLSSLCYFWGFPSEVSKVFIPQKVLIFQKQLSKKKFEICLVTDGTRTSFVQFTHRRLLEKKFKVYSHCKFIAKLRDIDI